MLSECSGGLEAGQKVGIVRLAGLGTTGARIAVINGAEVYAAEPRRQVWDSAQSLGVKKVVEDVKELAQFNLDLIVDFAGFRTTTAGASYRRIPIALVSRISSIPSRPHSRPIPLCL
jgi:alcohol dehydrogenase, propanol-preferring